MLLGLVLAVFSVWWVVNRSDGKEWLEDEIVVASRTGENKHIPEATDNNFLIAWLRLHVLCNIIWYY